MARNLLYILRRPFILALTWIFGMFGGLSVYAASNSSLDSLMRLVPFGRVSIVPLIAVTLFPFLISALAVYFSWSILILPVCFCRAVLLSFLSMGLVASTGWLVSCMLMLRSWVSAAPLYRFCLRHLSGDPVQVREIWNLIGLCFFLVSVDYWIILPVIRRLIVC